MSQCSCVCVWDTKSVNFNVGSNHKCVLNSAQSSDDFAFDY